MDKLSMKKKLGVVKQYLDGLSYDQIAAKSGISKGSVANIIVSLKAGMFLETVGIVEDIELLRELSQELKQQNLTPGQCATGLITLNQIKEQDKQWKAIPGITASMQAMMDSPCGKHLRDIQQSAPYYAEIFVMDNQGGNVCMTGKTSDYWQGDEAKFKKSFAGGAGAVFVDEVEFDDSTQAYLVQVSVPIKDGDKVIGAITFGIDVDKIE